MRGSEEVEIGVDLGGAAHAGSAPTVATSHQVSEFALDLGAGGPVVGDPPRILLLATGVGEAAFVAADADGASAFGFGVAAFSDGLRRPNSLPMIALRLPFIRRRR